MNHTYFSFHSLDVDVTVSMNGSPVSPTTEPAGQNVASSNYTHESHPEFESPHHPDY